MARWVVVHNAEDAVEAQAALDYLEAHDIDVRLRPHPDPHLAGSPISPGWGTIEVAPMAADDARALMERWADEPPQPVVESRRTGAVTQPLLGASPGQDRPRWAETRRDTGWLWWILIVSLIGNVAMATLWWQAEERARSAEQR